MSREGEVYDPKRTAELLGKYARLKKALGGFSIDQLEKSPVYVAFLQIQSNLKNLSLTGVDLMDMTEFRDLIVNNDDIRASSVYNDLLEEHNKHKEKYEDLERKHSRLKSVLRGYLKPSSGLIELLED